MLPLKPFTLAREREFYRYLPSDHSVYPFAPFDDESQKKFVPQPSNDHALLAFAQVGAIKLGTKHAMISLFDPTHQCVLAEATGLPTLDNRNELLLGCCVLPKERGICRVVTDLSQRPLATNFTVIGENAIVMLDVKKSEYLKSTELVPGLSKIRYFVGVPIISPRGIIIGSYCVLDTQPRESAPDEPSLTFMKDMAKTIMGYLDTLQSKVQNRQAERMIKGLGSFTEGKTTLRDSWEESNSQYAATKKSGEIVEGQLNRKQQDIQESLDHYEDLQDSNDCPEPIQLPSRPHRGHSPQPRVSSPECTKEPISNEVTANHLPKLLPNSHSDPAHMKDAHEKQEPSCKVSISDHSPTTETVSASLKNVFSRASNLIRESIEVEGVAFLDASIDSFGGLEDGNRKARQAYARGNATASSSDDNTDLDTPFHKDENDDTTKCRLLGSSTSTSSSIDDPVKSNDEFLMHASLLKSILNRYPHGKIFNYNEGGSLSDDSSNSSSSRKTNTSVKSSASATKRKKRKSHQKEDAENLIKVLVGARSIIFLPIWDSHKSKWFSGILVWTNTPKRVFTVSSELLYLRTFGNSIMAEVHRLDVEMAEKAKTNLISSISHELRSPLHGILGTANILSDTAMNGLQHGMVHTIESCGRTLLDTINHVLDFSYIDKFKNGSAQHKPNTTTIENQPSLPNNTLQTVSPSLNENSYPPVQLDAVLEEVVESVFAGHSFYSDPIARSRPDVSSKVNALSSKAVTVILDIHESAEWAFPTQAGCWRRILMNVFGNALKYTTSGFIYLELKVSPLREIQGSHIDVKSAEDDTNQFLVTLVVKDTGKGIDVHYLRNDLFTAFSQEDSLAPGSGLGLSIVRQALISLGGTIDVSSEKNIGTEITIEVPLSLTVKSDNKSDDSSYESNETFNSIRNLTRGKTIHLIGLTSSLESEKHKTLNNSLDRLCREWFGLNVELVSVESVLSQGNNTAPDFYLMVQTSFHSPGSKGDESLYFDRLTNGKDNIISPSIVVCHSPETAHIMSARATSRNENLDVHFISQPCGPRKLAKALSICMSHHDDQSLEAQDGDEPTRWVEMPESSYMPLDIGPRDSPNERMKLSKRPTNTETLVLTTPSQNGGNLPNTPLMDTSSPIDTTGTQIPENTEPSILVVDDNELNLKILVAFVKKEGWSYMTANNGLEAVETYKAHPSKFGAIILDLTMPVMDGLEATQHIRAAEKKYWLKNESTKPPWHPITIAALTGLDSANVQQEAFACGIDMFLTKPITRQALRPIFQRVRG